MEFGSNNILHLAVRLGGELARLQLPYCWIGGVAVQRWAAPRQTADVDAMVFAGFGVEQEIARQLLTLGSSRVESPLEFAVQARIVLMADAYGIGIDISLGGLPYEQRILERASDWSVPEHGTIRTCSAEDLVVLKSVANRPQDWIDIKNTIIRQGDKLDRELVVLELAPLVELKDEPEITDQLRQMFNTSY